jgi:hypothetical protein
MAELPQLDRSLAAPFENARTLVLRRIPLGAGHVRDDHELNGLPIIDSR